MKPFVAKNTRCKYWAILLLLTVAFAIMSTTRGVQKVLAGDKPGVPNNVSNGAFAQPLPWSTPTPNPFLDTTFHFDGKVTTEFTSASEEAEALEIQPDGKIIAGGHMHQPNTPHRRDFALARYNVDGSLDDGSANDSTPNDSFGQQGKVVTTFGLMEHTLTDLAIEADGKIVATGLLKDFNANRRIGLARYNADGSLDVSFNNGGTLVSNFGPADSTPEALAIQSDGKIVVAGYYLAGHNLDNFALARFNADGSRDGFFSNGGVFIRSFGESCANESSRAFDLTILPDGRIVAVGEAEVSCPALSVFVVAHFKADGTLDGTFNGGYVYTNFSQQSSGATAVAIQPDGKTVAAGWVQTNPMGDMRAFAMARYTVDGSLDSTFGSGGTVTTEMSPTATANAIAIESGGKIVLAGSTGKMDSLYAEDFLVARYTPNGILDPEFADGGTNKIEFGYTDGRQQKNDRAKAVAIQPDGRIVVAGTSGGTVGVAEDRYFVLGRLIAQVADLSIAMDVSTDDRITGTHFTYTITVTNHGPYPARSVVVTDYLPPELTDGKGNSLLVTMDHLAAGASETFTIEATVTCLAEAGEIVRNTASVTSVTHDPDLSNNTAVAEAIVLTALPIRCPSDIVQTSPLVNYPPPTVSSKWPGPIVVSCSPPSGSTFPVGTTQVQCTASDQSGNTASCSFNVTIMGPKI